jgi:hypothetical protein
MNNYQLLFPVNTVIYGDCYQNAVKNFVKLNYNLRLQELFLADQEKRYKINMKYSRNDIRNRVGFDVYQVPNNFSIPVVNNGLSLSDLRFWNPYSSMSLYGLPYSLGMPIIMP